ncbi:MAG: LuxR family transcriptional regulator [Rhizobium sp.]|nr:MAG: LuxR family transcriptional regulator [Rhizobium sp.]
MAISHESKSDTLLLEEIVRLYEHEPNLVSLPPILFEAVTRLIDADVVAYAEFHHKSGDFRALVSVDDDPAARGAAMTAYARHMNSHPFWQNGADFFGERALRESDFFDEETYLELPMVKEVFRPSRARHIIKIVMQHEDYSVEISGFRVFGRPPFSDLERDRLQGLRSHILRIYRQAQQRTLANLTPTDRLRIAFPQITARQLEVASWLAQGKSNEDIAAILDVGIDTVKAHVKALYTRIGADGRLATAIIAHTTPPFAQLPPLWTLNTEAWGANHSPAD